jgi:hypothetical protein
VRIRLVLLGRRAAVMPPRACLIVAFATIALLALAPASAGAADADAADAAAADAIPTVSVTGISAGATVSGTITLGANAGTGATQVKWFVDGVEVGWDGAAPWQSSWNSDSVADGIHTVIAKAADATGAWGTSAILSFVVANDIVGVSVTSPAAGATVSGTITLSATAADPSGITQMKWYVDGSEVGWDGSAPWTASWNTSAVGDGTHQITARGQNGLGLWISSAARSFTVQNGSSTQPSPSSKWRLVMSDNFDGSTLDLTKWKVYGPNWSGHNGNGLRDGRAVSIQNGTLTVTAQMLSGILVSGGVRSRIDQTYGRFEFRARADADPSQAMSAVVLTWPQSENFPIDGENDIWETLTDADRYPFSSFIHYSSLNRQYWFTHNADAKQWHDMAMEWEPNAIRIYRDGALVWTVSDSSAIPDVAHHLCIQLDAFKTWVSGAPRMQVDDVRIYSREW